MSRKLNPAQNQLGFNYESIKGNDNVLNDFCNSSVKSSSHDATFDSLTNDIWCWAIYKKMYNISSFSNSLSSCIPYLFRCLTVIFFLPCFFGRLDHQKTKSKPPNNFGSTKNPLRFWTLTTRIYSGLTDFTNLRRTEKTLKRGDMRVYNGYLDRTKTCPPKKGPWIKRKFDDIFPSPSIFKWYSSVFGGVKSWNSRKWHADVSRICGVDCIVKNGGIWCK